MKNQNDRRREARDLAERAIEQLERTDLSLVPVLLTVMRIARLIESPDVEQWMRLELQGYRGNFLPYASWSGREGSLDANGNQLYWVIPLEQVEAELAIARSNLAAATAPLTSVADSGQQTYFGGSTAERVLNNVNAQRMMAAGEIRKHTKIVATVRGAIHDWLSRIVTQLDYGTIVDSAYERVRERVDRHLAETAPDAGRALAAALARSSSDDPEEWSQALTSCRRAMKAVADALYPAREGEVDGHKVGEDDYLNRLTQFVKEKVASTSQREVMQEELESLHARATSLNSIASKGVHSAADRRDLEMAIVRTYFFLGEVLSLADEEAPPIEPHQAIAADAEGQARPTSDSDA